MTKLYFSKKDDNFNNAKRDFLRALELNKGANEELENNCYQQLSKIHVGYICKNLQNSKIKDEKICFEDMYNIIKEAEGYSKNSDDKKLINNINISLKIREAEINLESCNYNEKTKKILEEAIKESIEFRVVGLYCRACNLIATYYSKKDNHDLSIKYYTKAIDGFRL